MAKRVCKWALQQKAYFETQAIVTNINWPRMTQSLFQNHAMEWCMAQKDIKINLMETLFWIDFKIKLNKKFTTHN